MTTAMTPIGRNLVSADELGGFADMVGTSQLRAKIRTQSRRLDRASQAFSPLNRLLRG